MNKTQQTELRIQIAALEAKLYALRAVAFSDGMKLPWEDYRLIEVGETRADYIHLIDPDDLEDDEYVAVYGNDDDSETPNKEGAD